jgi:hypothetical protein
MRAGVDALAAVPVVTRQTAGTALLLNAARVLLCVVIFGLSFLLRFNDPGGSFAGLTDDHFFYVVRGWQILFGDLPVRDFVDHGAPLFYYVAAAVQVIGGRGTLSEIVFCTAALSAGAVATFLLAARASGSLLLGLFAAATQILLEPRFYNYPKIIVYAAAVPALWAFADRQSAPRRFLVALIIAVAFLFRHDHGVFVAIAMSALVALLHGVEWRDRVRHLAICGALVLALLTPYLVFVQANGGIVSYVAQASAWAERDRARAPVEWPGLFENPGGASAVTPAVGAIVRAAASVRNNGVAWLYYLELALPLIAIALLAVSPDAFRPRWPQATAKIGMVAVLGFVLNAGFLRSPLEARLADPSVPHTILLAWFCTAAAHACWRGAALRRSLAAYRAAVAALVLLLVAPAVGIAAVTLMPDVPGKLRKAALLDGSDLALERAARVRDTMRATWPLEGWTSPGQPGVTRLAFYLRDCIAPTGRVFVQDYLPQAIALSQRGFAGGHADLRPGFFETPEAQRLTIDRLRRQSVPIVVLGAGEDYGGFRGAFPLIAAYFDERYEIAGERALDDRFAVTVLVSRAAVPTRHYAPLDLPCFR